MDSASQDGYPAFLVSSNVKTFQGYGMGSYSDFTNPVYDAEAFEAPTTTGVQFHDLLTRFLTGSGGVTSVIDGTGAAVNAASPGPSDVASYP